MVCSSRLLSPSRRYPRALGHQVAIPACAPVTSSNSNNLQLRLSELMQTYRAGLSSRKLLVHKHPTFFSSRGTTLRPSAAWSPGYPQSLYLRITNFFFFASFPSLSCFPLLLLGLPNITSQNKHPVLTSLFQSLLLEKLNTNAN